MFAKSVVATTLLALVAATVANEPASQCTTGPIQCCDSTTSTITPVLAALLGSLGINVSGVALPIGLTCVSIVGSDSCTQQPVCCENNNFSGEVALGCNPVNINL